MKLTHEQLETLLTSFRRIRPRAEFSKHSKMLIMASPRHTTLATPVTISWIARTIRMGAFITAGAAVLILSFYATRELSPLLLPGLNAQKITAEADMINSSINIELSRIGYFEHSPKILTPTTSLSSATATPLLPPETTASSSPISPEELNTVIKQLSK